MEKCGCGEDYLYPFNTCYVCGKAICRLCVWVVAGSELHYCKKCAHEKIKKTPKKEGE